MVKSTFLAIVSVKKRRSQESSAAHAVPRQKQDRVLPRFRGINTLMSWLLVVFVHSSLKSQKRIENHFPTPHSGTVLLLGSYNIPTHTEKTMAWDPTNSGPYDPTNSNNSGNEGSPYGRQMDGYFGTGPTPTHHPDYIAGELLRKYNDSITQKRPSNDTSSCFVATACFDRADHPTVQELRHFRDTVLNHSKLGRAFVTCYCRIGPKAASVVQSIPFVKPPLRRVLSALSRMLNRAIPAD